MERVLNYLIDTLKIKNGDSIVVGNSGGPDSMCLMYILEKLKKKYDIKIICAHVNHNVRKESKSEQEFLKQYCYEHNIVFEHMKIEESIDDNFENHARKIRYNYFEKIIDKYNSNYLMTAHHGDDLMETILMRIVRGSTLKGYSGFEMLIDKENYKIVRPLVFLTKSEIQEFDIKNNIPYVIDQSNFNEIHTRNRYRKNVLPFLKSEDKNVNNKFLKFSNTLLEYNDYINREITKKIKNVYVNNELSIKKYNELDPLIQKKIIYTILENIYEENLMLVNDVHVDLIRNLIKSEKSNNEINLPNNIKVIKSYDLIKIVKNNTQFNKYELELTDYVKLPNGCTIEKVDFDEKNDNNICRILSNEVILPLYVKTRTNGDKIELKKLGHKKIKDVFIDCKIPMCDRDTYPIIIDSTGEVIWIPGIKKSKFAKQKNEIYDIIYKYQRGEKENE